MTEAEARDILAGPLKFGDDAQLAAVHFLRDCAACRADVTRCRHCDGEGVNRQGYACPWCAAAFSAEVLRACGIDAKTEGQGESGSTHDKARSRRRLVDPLC